MPLFQLKNKSADQIPVNLKQFKDEAALRDFFADNLEELLGLKFLAKEYFTKDGRIDTLAIDEAGTPVVIEYKWNEKDTILTQGLFYIDWLKENKRLFDAFVADKLGKENKVIWDSPRLILIAQGFDRYTLSAVKQVKNSVELIKYTPYSSSILFLETVYGSDTTKPAKEIVRKREIGTYDDVKKMFYALQEEIKKWANVEERIDQKVGITYWATKSFVRFEFGKSYIDILVRDSRYGYKIDPKNMVKDITSYKYGYKGKIKLKSKDDVSYVLDLIRQSYESTL